MDRICCLICYNFLCLSHTRGKCSVFQPEENQEHKDGTVFITQKEIESCPHLLASCPQIMKTRPRVSNGMLEYIHQADFLSFANFPSRTYHAWIGGGSLLHGQAGYCVLCASYTIVQILTA